MNIYVDLDDTLIHSVYGVGRNPGKRTVVRLSEDDIYHSLLRPEAGRLLSSLRRVGQVKMLTTAIDEYARAHNKLFSLGFRDDEIIARESYITKIQIAYGTDWVPSATGTDPEAVLIDNLPPSTESSRTKRAFLGIRDDGYFQIREFNGKDPEGFSEEIDKIVAKITARAVRST